MTSRWHPTMMAKVWPGGTGTSELPRPGSAQHPAAERTEGLGCQGGDCSCSPKGRTRSHKNQGTARSSGERSLANDD